MTSMPDAVAAPSRTVPSQRGGSAGDDARDSDFSSLVDDAAEDESDEAATRSDRLHKRREPRPDSPAAAQAAITQAVVQPAVQPGSSTDAPLMPWMVATIPATPSAASAAPAPDPGEAAAQPGQQALSAAGNGSKTAGTAAVPQQPAEPSMTGSPTPVGPAQSGTSADGPVQGSMDQSAPDPAFPQTTQSPAETPAPTAAMAAPAASTDTATDARASRRDESTDPRTALRSARGTGRPDVAEKANQPAATPAAPRTAQPAADATAAAIAPEPAPAPAFGAPPTAGAGSGTAATGFEALPTLPAQAATQYAAAAASGRAATAHSPAMAQLAAPLVRVLETGGGEFHIDLAPAELGRIRVVADVSDGKVSLTVQAEQADTLALLRRDLQQLERALGDAGLSLDNASLQFSLQDDGQSRGFAAPDQGGAAAGWRAQAQSEASPEPVAERPMRPIDGLVDVTV